MKKLAQFLLFMTITFSVMAQNKKETFYYTEYWDICSKSEATYYRIITLDPNQKPVGIVRDYYISGKLQSEGEAIFFDKLDDAKTKWKNKVTGYYENGKPLFEDNYDNEGNQIEPKKNWDEYGVMDIAINFRNKTLNQLQDSQLNATKEEFKRNAEDEHRLEGGKIIRKKESSGEHSYYIVDDKDDLMLYVLYSKNYLFQYSASKIIDLDEIREMERELTKKGFEKVKKMASNTIASNSSKNLVPVEVWTHQDYPYSFYLQPFDCYKKNCQIGMYANTLFTNP